jgi:hypothetical protein
MAAPLAALHTDFSSAYASPSESMTRPIVEKSALSADERLELATLLCETFGPDGVSQVYLGCPYDGNKQYWLEFYLEGLDRALRTGRIFVIYDSAGKVTSVAVAFPPGVSLEAGKDVENVHHKYVEEHQPAERKPFLEEVGCSHRRESSQGRTVCQAGEGGLRWQIRELAGGSVV